jgi:hypothetical protein
MSLGAISAAATIAPPRANNPPQYQCFLSDPKADMGEPQFSRPPPNVGGDGLTTR